MNTISNSASVATQQPITVPEASARSSETKSTQAMILEFQALMRKLYNTYVECHAALEKNVADLQKLAYQRAIDAKDQRKKAEVATGVTGIVTGGFSMACGIGGGIIGLKTPLGYGMGVEMGSHLGTPASGIGNAIGQTVTAGTRGKAEEAQIHADLARNVSDSAARDAGKARDNADQHHDQYLREAGQLTQEMIAAIKATVAPR
ncbi:hypothetical protein [Cupriavidus cauae]|uniref:Uncharacterized protein n=1 Tax=Cupriavidus cauae TaxID=2608999 RepID=A0A5M8AF91_9BURK|nr:hypothetical protein [Cupriavidus cauae]KAA0182852.1 hypothetical protein FX016_01615 [Cupriavidus gilardii]KAA6120736.1 hypothetical protein F1599_16235 [Cupriavidus cauae]